MEDADSDFLGLDFLRQQYRAHVGGTLGHVVSVIVALRILRRPPRNTSALRRDHDDLGPFFQ